MVSGVAAEGRSPGARGWRWLGGHRPDSSLACVIAEQQRDQAPSGSIPALVAASLLVVDMPDSTWDEREAAARYVDDSVAAMPDFTRFGVRVAGAGAYGVLCVLAGGSFRNRPERQRARLAARLTGVPLPVLGEFGRLTRGLGLAAVHESRHAATASRAES